MEIGPVVPRNSPHKGLGAAGRGLKCFESMPTEKNLKKKKKFVTLFPLHTEVTFKYIV